MVFSVPVRLFMFLMSLLGSCDKFYVDIVPIVVGFPMKGMVIEPQRSGTADCIVPILNK